MKSKTLLLALYLLVSAHSFSQQFYLGDRLSPTNSKFKLMGVSSATGVSTYHYIGVITDTYYNRRIGDILVGVKNGIIVNTIYNLIPKTSDVGVPKSIIDLVQSALPFPLAYSNGTYGVNIDNETIAISRSNNVLTFNKDRILFMNSVKNSHLRQ